MKKSKKFNEKKSKCRICCEYKTKKKPKKYLKKNNYFLIHPKLDIYNIPICNSTKYEIKNSCNI